MKVKKISDFAAFENAPDKKPGYTPPYKFKLPKSPENYYDIICPYTPFVRGTIKFDGAPIKFAKPRLMQDRQLTAPPEKS